MNKNEQNSTNCLPKAVDKVENTTRCVGTNWNGMRCWKCSDSASTRWWEQEKKLSEKRKERTKERNKRRKKVEMMKMEKMKMKMMKMEKMKMAKEARRTK